MCIKVLYNGGMVIWMKKGEGNHKLNSNIQVKSDCNSVMEMLRDAIPQCRAPAKL
jgi:hypothetical protein